MGFSKRGRSNNDFTPHMTVAYRDLSPDNFERAWEDFQDRSFDYSFEVNSIVLLKHDYQRWKPFYEFNFS
ncbi:MAG: 2'-5' RNA ligase family protein [Fodinibius sp.]|nr:2'-5' RNA ligase family protein [Fodinibius sp.]